MVYVDFSTREKNIWVYVTMFMFWSFLGGMAEHFFHATGTKKGERYMSNPVTTGFPIYGIGAYIIVALHRTITHKFGAFIEFFVYATILSLFEYWAGKLVGAGPENHIQEDGTIKFWDYSDKVLNYNGLADLEHFLFYGLVGIAVSRLHPLIVGRLNCAFGEPNVHFSINSPNKEKYAAKRASRGSA